MEDMEIESKEWAVGKCLTSFCSELNCSGVVFLKEDKN